MDRDTTKNQNAEAECPTQYFDLEAGEPMIRQPWGGNIVTIEISVGAVVITADGKELGKTKKVETGAFQVDAPRQFDYWLHTHLAKTSTAERVELTITEADLGSYKMDNPHDHNEFQAAVPEKLRPATVRDGFINR